jgi:hypothetical protein
VTLLYRYVDEGVCWILCNYSSTYRSIHGVNSLCVISVNFVGLRKNVKIGRMNELFLEVSRCFYSVMFSKND